MYMYMNTDGFRIGSVGAAGATDVYCFLSIEYFYLSL